MGYYIEPKGQTFFEWLEDNATMVSVDYLLMNPDFDYSGEQAVLCLVDNGPNHALGVCYSRAEFERFLPRPHLDDRDRWWYLADKGTVIIELGVDPWVAGDTGHSEGM